MQNFFISWAIGMSKQDKITTVKSLLKVSFGNTGIQH